MYLSSTPLHHLSRKSSCIRGFSVIVNVACLLNKDILFCVVGRIVVCVHLIGLWGAYGSSHVGRSRGGPCVSAALICNVYGWDSGLHFAPLTSFGGPVVVEQLLFERSIAEGSARVSLPCVMLPSCDNNKGAG